MSEDGRISPLDLDEAPDDVRPTFEAFVRARGVVPNLYRVIGHAPRIAATLATHQQAVMGPGTVPVLLKELLSVRVSHINLCDY